jgi:hypothetical protein
MFLRSARGDTQGEEKKGRNTWTVGKCQGKYQEREGGRSGGGEIIWIAGKGGGK